MSASEISILPVKGFEAFKQLEDLQRKAWGMDDLDIIPTHAMYAAEEAGGQILCAFLPSGEPIGFSLAFLAHDKANREKYLYSHMMGIVPEFQSRDFGFQLKMAQKKHALTENIQRIDWTYDALLTRNANLNIRKLGGKVRTFHQNLYGRVRSDLYGDVLTDRFIVSWNLTSAIPVAFPTDVTPITTVRESRPHLISSALTSGYDNLEFIVPLDHATMRKTDPTRARAWQDAVRAVSAQLLNGEYEITSFRINNSDESGSYLFQRVRK